MKFESYTCKRGLYQDLPHKHNDIIQIPEKKLDEGILNDK